MYICGRGFVSFNHQKTIRFDDYTLEIINNYRGCNFSDKLRNYVYDVERGRELRVNCNTKSAD